MARQSTKRAPRLSTIFPMNGDVKAANIPPSDTAPEIIVRDHSSSMVIGVTNIDSVATAGPCLANPAQQIANKTNQINLLKDTTKLLEQKVKLVQPKWYENKWLYFTFGVALTATSVKLAGQIVD